MYKLLLTILDEEGHVLGEHVLSLNNNQPSEPENNLKNQEKMTDAQRRYLFRLLMEKGIQGEATRQYLKENLKVADVKDISKGQASWLIERLKKQEVQNEGSSFSQSG